MTKEQILQRKTKLETERDNLKANLAAYEGAIQDCNYWLQAVDITTDTPVADSTPAATEEPTQG